MKYLLLKIFKKYIPVYLYPWLKVELVIERKVDPLQRDRKGRGKCFKQGKLDEMRPIQDILKNQEFSSLAVSQSSFWKYGSRR
jgi:hypothetical protein